MHKKNGQNCDEKEVGKKVAAISLSNNTGQRRIADMSKYIKEHIGEEICLSSLGLFLIYVDKSTDVESCSQLMAFVRYVYSGKLKEFLFCATLKGITKT